MKIKNNRENFIEVKNITIQLTEETSLRMTVTNKNRLVITKVNDDDNSILVKPCVSNQLEIF